VGSRKANLSTKIIEGEWVLILLHSLNTHSTSIKTRSKTTATLEGEKYVINSESLCPICKGCRVDFVYANLEDRRKASGIKIHGS
jgi:hypothetical protein